MNKEAINFLRRSSDFHITTMDAMKLLRRFNGDVEKCLEFFHSSQYRKWRQDMLKNKY